MDCHFLPQDSRGRRKEVSNAKGNFYKKVDVSARYPPLRNNFVCITNFLPVLGFEPTTFRPAQEGGKESSITASPILNDSH